MLAMIMPNAVCLVMLTVILCSAWNKLHGRFEDDWKFILICFHVTIGKLRKGNVRGGIRTHAQRTLLVSDYSISSTEALDRSATLTWERTHQLQFQILSSQVDSQQSPWWIHVSAGCRIQCTRILFSLRWVWGRLVVFSWDKLHVRCVIVQAKKQRCLWCRLIIF